MTSGPKLEAVAVPRPLLTLVGAAAATITIAGMRGISDLIAPAFLALVMTIAAHPLRGWLRARGLPGWGSTLVVIIVVYAVLVGLAITLIASAARFATLLPTYQEQAASMLEGSTAWLSGLGVGDEQIAALTQTLNLGALAGQAAALLGELLSVLTGLFFIVTLVLFLAVDAAWFPGRLGELTANRQRVVPALVSFAHGTRRYLLVSTIFGLIVAVIDTGLLWALGIPAPLLWGLLAFITNYIPNIGFVIGLIPPTFLALLEGGPGLMLAVIALYSVVNVVIQSVIQPKVIGDAVGLSTTLTFLSVVFWAWVLGALGALLAIPLSLLAKALLVDIDPDTRWLAFLLAADAKPIAQPPAPPE